MATKDYKKYIYELLDSGIEVKDATYVNNILRANIDHLSQVILELPIATNQKIIKAAHKLIEENGPFKGIYDIERIRPQFDHIYFKHIAAFESTHKELANVLKLSIKIFKYNKKIAQKTTEKYIVYPGFKKEARIIVPDYDFYDFNSLRKEVFGVKFSIVHYIVLFIKFLIDIFLLMTGLYILGVFISYILIYKHGDNPDKATDSWFYIWLLIKLPRIDI